MTAAPTVYQAEVTHPAPATATADLWVLIPALAGREHRFGPCPWPYTGALPQAGDRCAVALADGDRDQTWWVLAFDSRDL